MLCLDINCKELDGDKCTHYSLGYMEFVTRRGYCPFVEEGPNRPKGKEGPKRLIGQQKGKLKKRK
jgi:hypothetical protein